ncbi:MAG: NGG1p interacting factor NIF3 [Candidatus Aminicenantes bacterium]|nr:MAG: NGG1p interacting factor NIF3 [Candidatus Aminicenantes bacterium]
MKLEDLYHQVIKIGQENDLRPQEEIDSLLAKEKEKFEKLSAEEKEYYDLDRLFNPYADTRILHGHHQLEVKKVIVGIDMEAGEILLTYLLNQYEGQKIDLIIAHHPEGKALAQLYEVMKLQPDLLARFGVTISVAEQLLEKRIAEVERRLLPINHARHVDLARALNLPMMCIHTPADNCVTRYLHNLFEEKKPCQLKDILEILNEIPEYRIYKKMQVAPKIVSGSENNKCGQIFVDMTGGTEGSKEIFDNLASRGISTLVGMHYSEEHLERAKKANLNVVIAGHMASDVLGLNLLFDELEKSERLDFVEVSGFRRIRR